MSAIPSRVDELLQFLHKETPHSLSKPLITDYSIADYYHHSLDNSYYLEPRPVINVVSKLWRILAAMLGHKISLYILFLFGFIVSLVSILRYSFQLFEKSYRWEGDEQAKIVLLRTGVANEPRIANWLSKQFPNQKVSMIKLDEDTHSFINIRSFPDLFLTHCRLSYEYFVQLKQLLNKAYLDKATINILMPVWLVLLMRRAPSISYYYTWTRKYLVPKKISHIYFTFNYCAENAFLCALPNVVSATVEHGFPRRNIPPLPCKQYVYTEGYKHYLHEFDPNLEIEKIGIDYFPKSNLLPTKTIVVASLQDWPQFKIESVKHQFNQALKLAKHWNWNIVFRTRSYDSDAFSSALVCQWDDISEVKRETFDECLKRVKPAMVWTTWSTAILDALAFKIPSVTFVTQELHDHFLTDIDELSKTVYDDTDLHDIEELLQYESMEDLVNVMLQQIENP